MTSIICKAYFLNPTETTIIAVSPSFQCALTPWLVTMAAETIDFSCSVAEIECFALAPTFQFTRSLRVFLFLSEGEEEQRGGIPEQRFLKSNLCTPLFSHLQFLGIIFEGGTTILDVDGVADFVLKFQRLENIELSLCPESMAPSELIAFYMRLFHSQKLSRTLLVNVIKSYAENIINRRCSEENIRDYCDLTRKHKIVSFLVQKMVEVYRTDHGESLCVFLGAIQYSLGRRDYCITGRDSIDELVPMFDLIETIVMNGDLLHPVFQPQQADNSNNNNGKNNKFGLDSLLGRILQLVSACTQVASYSELEFMQQYGRTLLPQLADFIFSKYDGSQDALGALSLCLELFFGVIEDAFWCEEMAYPRDEEGQKKMLEGGRKLLQHIPFDKVRFVIEEAIRCHTCYTMSWLDGCLSGLRHYLRYTTASPLQHDEVKDPAACDVASQLIKHNILPLGFDLVVTCFEQHVRYGGPALLAGYLRTLCSFLRLSDTSRSRSRAPPFITMMKMDFFSNRDGFLKKMVDFANRVCDYFEDAFRGLRRVTEGHVDPDESACVEDFSTTAAARVAARCRRTATEFAESLLPCLWDFAVIARAVLRGNDESRNTKKNNNNNRHKSTATGEKPSTDNNGDGANDGWLVNPDAARIKRFMARFDELTLSFEEYMEENRGKMKWFENY